MRAGPDRFVLLLPVAVLALHAGHGHAGDLESFHRWYLAVREGPAFYAHAAGINYPVVGVLLVTAPALLVEAITGAPLGFDAYETVHQTTLALGEIAWIAIAASLAVRLGSPRPWLVAGAAYLVPSTWSVGAFFGQIDTIGSGLVLALLVALHDAASEDATARRRGAYALVAASVLIVLFKPLPWLALPAVGMALVPARRTLDRRALAIGGSVAILLCLAVEAVVAWPLGAPSSVLIALRAPLSAHGELAVAGGASLWSFFVRSGTSSHVLVPPGVELALAGTCLFAFATGTTLLLAFLALVGPQPSRPRRTLVVTAIAASLTGVAAAYFLPGSHERYCAQALAPVVLAALAAPDLGKRRGLVLGTAGLAGLYVAASIHWGAFSGWLTPLREPWLLAIAQPAFLAAGAWTLRELGRTRASRSSVAV